MGALSRRLEVEESCLAYETEGSMKAGAVQETQQSRDHGQKAAERRELAVHARISDAPGMGRSGDGDVFSTTCTVQPQCSSTKDEALFCI